MVKLKVFKFYSPLPQTGVEKILDECRRKGRDLIEKPPSKGADQEPKKKREENMMKESHKPLTV